MFCDGSIYTELVAGAGRSTKCPRMEMSVELGENLLFPFFTGLNVNPKEFPDLKDVL